jgi:ATP-binding protein involved in chromosome partitioning
MSAVTQEAVIGALKHVKEPELQDDLVTLNMIKGLRIEGSKVSFTIVLTTPACPLIDEIKNAAREAVASLPGVTEVEISTEANVTRGQTQVKDNLIPLVKNSIAVSSGKGGVGKTTVSVNLAVALAKLGAKVGILDADIYGPNVPLMLGVKTPPAQEGNRIKPAESHGVKLMSMAFFVPDDTPMVWRGPMIHGAIQQFLRDVDWGELDYLVVDLPPGTGDAQLSISQLVPLTGAVIVTTPQEVALLDSKKGLAMFKKVNVPVLGIVENMSYFLCPHCNERTEIFSHGGGKLAAEKLGVPFLGEIPIDANIREGGDTGLPILVSHPKSPQSEAFLKIARTLAAAISVQNARSSALRIIME